MNQERRRILLVVDDMLLAEITDFRLSLLGYDVESVQTGARAVDHLNRYTPDLMIVDTDIRDMEATQLVRQTRTRFSPDEVPIVVFSMDSSLDAVRCVHAAGANDYVITPFDPAVLEAKIHQLMTGRPAARQPVLNA